MTREEIKKRLEMGPLLFDGGIGTEIYARGVFINKCFEEMNLSSPNLIQQIHEEYIKAGADVIKTNTFGATKFKLQKFDLFDKIYDLNFQGAKIAKDVAKDDILIAGSIGPLGKQIEPLGKLSENEAKEFFKLQIQPLIDGGVDLLLFETFINPRELHIAVVAAREIKDIFCIAQITIDDDGSALTGGSAEFTIKELEDIDADVIGANCTVGPRDMLNWLESVRPLTKKPISVLPNAGKPKNIEGRNIYLSTPEYLGEYAKHFVLSGANIIGGCCGTGPEHISKMRNMLNAVNPESKREKIKITEKQKLEDVEPIPLEKKSRLSSKIAKGKFVTFVELLAPKGVAAFNEINKAKELFFNDVDVINIPDGPRASARMSAGSLALQIQKEIGIETVLHFVCRDRNVIGMQSDLMGFYALGLRNILAITGDPPKIGNYPDATAVFDVDAIGLVNILSRLNHGMDIAGNPIGDPTGFSVGVGANPGALDLENEINRLYWKVEAGAEYVVTQPVFDIEVFYRFLDAAKHIKIPIISGIWPLVSFRNAQFMNNEVPGVDVPKDILKRMEKHSGDREKSVKEGVEIAIETLTKIRKEIAGVQISAPFGRIAPVIDILNSVER